MIIRKYCNTDLSAIEKIDSFFATVLKKYHTGIKDENIICAIDDTGELIGFGYLKIHQSIDANKKQTITFSTQLNESHQEDGEIEELLMNGLIGRFHKIKNAFSDKRWCLRVCCETDEINDMQFFLEKGFSLQSVVPVLKYDLLKEIKHYEIPNDVFINEFSFTESSMEDYINADLIASDALECEADIWFKTGDPSFKCFVATCDSQIVGAISVWNISNERAVTENIFVVPSFRRKNIARELIATAFEELKNRGMSIATLSMSGTNLPAMKLYLSSGYSLYYNLIEMIYE